MPLFFWLLDTAIINSHLVYNTAGSKVSHAEFRLRLAWDLITLGNDIKNGRVMQKKKRNHEEEEDETRKKKKGKIYRKQSNLKNYILSDLLPIICQCCKKRENHALGVTTSMQKAVWSSNRTIRLDQASSVLHVKLRFVSKKIVTVLQIIIQKETKLEYELQ